LPGRKSEAPPGFCEISVFVMRKGTAALRKRKDQKSRPRRDKRPEGREGSPKRRYESLSDFTILGKG